MKVTTLYDACSLNGSLAVPVPGLSRTETDFANCVLQGCLVNPEATGQIFSVLMFPVVVPSAA